MDSGAIPKILNRADTRLLEINNKLARKNGPSSRNIAFPDAIPISHRELSVDVSRNIWFVFDRLVFLKVCWTKHYLC